MFLLLKEKAQRRRSMRVKVSNPLDIQSELDPQSLSKILQRGLNNEDLLG